MAEIGAIRNQPKADSEPHQAESTDHERDIAAVSVHRSGRNCGYNVLPGAATVGGYCPENQRRTGLAE
jgi:hypothetical protein